MELARIHTDDGVTRISLQGLLTRDQALRDRDPIVEKCGKSVYSRRLLFDLSDCHHVDSTGVEWLLTSHRKCEEGGGVLIIHSPQEMVRQVLHMMRMELVLNIFRDETEALKFHSPSQNGNEPHTD